MKEIVGYALGPQQTLLWNEKQRSDLGVQASLLVEGPLDISKLQQAIDCIVARHEILRTSFAWLAGMQTPLQVIDPPASVKITELDESQTQLTEESWSTAEPLRVKLVRLETTSTHCCLVSQHCAATCGR